MQDEHDRTMSDVGCILPTSVKHVDAVERDCRARARNEIVGRMTSLLQKHEISCYEKN